MPAGNENSFRIDFHQGSFPWRLNTLMKGHQEAVSPEVFCKIGDLKNFVKCTGKHLCQSPVFNKVAG